MTTSQSQNLTAIPTPANTPGGVTVDQYNACVIYYFDTQLNADIMNLNAADQAQFFQMFHDHSDIMYKVFHAGIPIINYILFGNELYDAQKNPHPGINTTPSPMVAAYKIWAASKGYPVPAVVS